MVLEELELDVLEARIPQEEIKLLLSRIFWIWYSRNLDRKLPTIKFWFIKKTFKVRDLELIFTFIFGPAIA